MSERLQKAMRAEFYFYGLAIGSTLVLGSFWHPVDWGLLCGVLVIDLVLSIAWVYR